MTSVALTWSTNRIAERLRAWAQAHPGRLVALGLLLFATAWLPELAWTSLAPPGDNLEQLTWIHSIEGGYYKHPPLATWLFWLPAQLFGVTAWATYLTGAACTLGSIALLWHLLTELRGQRRAALAVLAVLCITYYNGRLHFYNHNVALMPFVAASALLCWRACATRSLGAWAALGLVVGLGSLVKYQMAVAVACVLVYWLVRRGWRDERQRQGLLLALLVALLVFAPHVRWLEAHDFAPIHYAMDSSLGLQLGLQARSADSLQWLLDQLANRAVPAWLLLGVAWHTVKRRGSRAASPPEPAPTDGSRALLLVWGLVPLLFTTLVGLLFGADLQLEWGTSFLLFAVPAAMEALPGVPWVRVPLRPVLITFAALQFVLLSVNVATSPRGPRLARDDHWRGFDSARLARLLQAPARRALGGPICVVSGPPVPAGALALALDDHPRVLIDGRFDRSPWISRQRVEACGLLELAEDAPLPGGRPVGPAFPRLSWRIVPPRLGDPSVADWP